MLWDPAVIVDKKAKAEGRTPLLAKMQKHTGGVSTQAGAQIEEIERAARVR